MRVLFLAPRVPYPTLDRENVRPYHAIRFLSLRHDVDLVTFGGRGVEWDARRRLRRFCPRVQILPMKGARRVVPASARHVFTTQPLAISRYESRDLMERLEALNETNRYDLIYVYSSSMAQYVTHHNELFRFMQFAELDSDKFRQYGEHMRGPAAWIYRREARRLLEFERDVARTFAACAVVSQVEKDLFMKLTKASRPYR